MIHFTSVEFLEAEGIDTVAMEEAEPIVFDDPNGVVLSKPHFEILFIEYLEVSKRGAGLGKKMVADFLKSVPPYTKEVYLEAMASPQYELSQENLFKFYRSFGFEIVDGSQYLMKLKVA